MEKLNKISKVFLRWLKEKGIYNAYVTEYTKYMYRSHERSDLISILNFESNSPSELINSTLHWADTKQGGDFWYDIYGQWKQYCSAKMIV